MSDQTNLREEFPETFARLAAIRQQVADRLTLREQRGWFCDVGSRKKHYFNCRRTLCAKTAKEASLVSYTPEYPGDTEDLDNCATCRKVLAARRRASNSGLNRMMREMTGSAWPDVRRANEAGAQRRVELAIRSAVADKAKRALERLTPQERALVEARHGIKEP